MTCLCFFAIMPGGARILAPRGLCPDCRVLLKVGDKATRWRVAQLRLARRLYQHRKCAPYNLGPVKRPWPDIVCDHPADKRTRDIRRLPRPETPLQRRKRRALWTKIVRESPERPRLEPGSALLTFQIERIVRKYFNGMSFREAVQFVEAHS